MIEHRSCQGIDTGECICVQESSAIGVHSTAAAAVCVVLKPLSCVSPHTTHHLRSQSQVTRRVRTWLAAGTAARDLHVQCSSSSHSYVKGCTPIAQRQQITVPGRGEWPRGSRTGSNACVVAHDCHWPRVNTAVQQNGRLRHATLRAAGEGKEQPELHGTPWPARVTAGQQYCHEQWHSCRGDERWRRWRSC